MFIGGGVGGIGRIGGGGPRGATPTPPPAGQPFPTVSTTPTIRLHGGQSTIAETSGRATSVSDLQGNPPAINGAGSGPLVVTDGNGWKFLRFNTTEFLSGGASDAVTGVSLDTRNCTVVMVMRAHRSRTNPLMSIGNGTFATGGASNAFCRLVTNGSSAGYLGSTRAGIPSYASNRQNMLPGCELQVIAVRSSVTALRYYVNNQIADSTVANNNTAVAIGYELARTASNLGSSGSWGQYDLYDLLIYNSALSDAAITQVVSEMVAGYSIAPKTNRLVMVGNSITFGLNGLSGENPAMRLTDPAGDAAVPSSYNVLNVATSGWTIANMVTQRDDANTVFAERLAGRNVISLHCGTNNMDSPNNQSGATTYAALVPLLNTTTTGYLQRLWEVYVDRIIAYDNATVQPRIEDYRALIAAPAFLTDTLSGSGQTYEGKVVVNNVCDYQFGGGPLFLTRANAQNINVAGIAPYFDGVHLTGPVGNPQFAAAKRAGMTL